jgi:hypothetical protein
MFPDACVVAYLKNKNPAYAGLFGGGRYWARTSDPQLVELVLSGGFAGLVLAVGKDLGKSHTGTGGVWRSQADDQGRESAALVDNLSVAPKSTNWTESITSATV